jgi:hypothetical protein
MTTALRTMAILQGILGVSMGVLGFWCGIRCWQIMGPLVALAALTVWR